MAENAGSQLLHELRTAGFVAGTSAGGGLPTRNFRSGAFEGAAAILELDWVVEALKRQHVSLT